MARTYTWYIRTLNVGGTNPNRLWWDIDPGAAVTQATSVTGWTVNKLGAGNYATLNQGAENATFSTTIVPNATAPAVDNNYPSTVTYTPPTLLSDVQSISTLYEYNGYFPAGTWTFSFPVIAVTSGGDQDGNITMRVFKATRSGTAWANVTELTAAMLTGSTVTNLTTTTALTSTVTWSAGAFYLNNEFLICKLGWQISGAGGANGRDVVLRYGTGCTMVSPLARERDYNIT